MLFVCLVLLSRSLEIANAICKRKRVEQNASGHFWHKNRRRRNGWMMHWRCVLAFHLRINNRHWSFSFDFIQCFSNRDQCSNCVSLRKVENDLQSKQSWRYHRHNWSNGINSNIWLPILTSIFEFSIQHTNIRVFHVSFGPIN